METYAFETKDGSRFDVKATSVNAAHNKIKSIPYLLSIITGYYYMYDADGLHAVYEGWAGKV